ncbi:S-adenosyl-L-methionine-dependent methyltransferase [Gracilaria domingensis]|nr:S-adenosyl-L-methionine-dependent methyltransferase [Gracilaria domingensis]
MRIRESRPRIVWEVSPSHGYSTLWITEAVMRNNNKGQVYSFDVQNIIEGLDKIKLQKNGWHFILGDFKQSFDQYSKQYPLPDYLFLDCLHTEDFARFYTNRLFPTVLQHSRTTLASLHDVYNPGFWSDKAPTDFRERGNLPNWLANEEGQIVLDWMVFTPKCVSGSFTVSSARNLSLVLKIKSIRSKHKISEFADIGGWNPTLFFRLEGGCMRNTDTIAESKKMFL